MIAGIAAMQLVEQGQLSLDDAEQAGKIAPELVRVKVLKGFDENDEPILEEKKRGITLRMLLSHTGENSAQKKKQIINRRMRDWPEIAGFGYTFFNPEVRKIGFPAGIDEFSGRIEDIGHPLLFQPGSQWAYGVSTFLRHGWEKKQG